MSQVTFGMVQQEVILIGCYLNGHFTFTVVLTAAVVTVVLSHALLPGSCPENNIWKETKSNNTAYVNCSKIMKNLGIDKQVSREWYVHHI